MQESDFLSFLPPLLRRYLIPFTLGAIGIVLIGIGFLPLIFKPQANTDVIFEQGAEHEASVAAASTMVIEEKIQIDVSGGVVKPGVYALSPDARVQDVITMAGGFSDKANTEWIAKNLNLAAKLTDAAKIYIPFAGEELATSGSMGSTSTTGTTGNTGLININSANQGQLESLPGVGPVTAAKIISGRPYGSVDELLGKKIVGASVFEKIKGEISIN